MSVSVSVCGCNMLNAQHKHRVLIKRGENIVETKEVRCSDEGCCLGYLGELSHIR